MKLLQNRDESSQRILVLGNQNVGKTALIVRALTRRFLPEYAPCSETTYRFEKTDRRKSCFIVDSDGKNTEMFVGTKAFVLVYSITCRKSLESLKQTVDKIRLLDGDSASIIIVGNKNDLTEKRRVSRAVGEKFAHKLGAEHFELSAATDVEETVDLFNYIIGKMPAFRQSERKQSKFTNPFKSSKSSS